MVTCPFLNSSSAIIHKLTQYTRQIVSLSSVSSRPFPMTIYLLRKKVNLTVDFQKYFHNSNAQKLNDTMWRPAEDFFKDLVFLLKYKCKIITLSRK